MRRSPAPFRFAMHPTVPAALLAACLSVSAVMPVGATDITPAEADVLQAQMQSWLRGMLGPDTQPPGHAVQVRPEGDHYRIELPLGTPRIGQPGPVTLSASAKPAEGGRWTFEGPDLPSTASITLDMPDPTRKGQKAPVPTIPVEFTIKTGSADSRGVFDASFASPSTLSISCRDLQIQARSAVLNQLTKIERSSSTSTLRPSGADRVDFTSDSAIEGYSVSSQFQDEPSVELSAQNIRVISGITGLSRSQAATMIPAVVQLVSGFLAAAPDADGDALVARPSVDPQLLRTIVQLLPDLASEFTMNEMLDGVVLRSKSRNGAANQVRIGMSVMSKGGLLQANMDLGLDGLVLPNVASGTIAELLPRKIALHPVLTGVPTEELVRWLGAIGEAKASDRPPVIAMPLLRAGVSAGLDSFAIDIGGASFAGTGKLTVVSTGDLTGQAQVTATNFDDLVQRANEIPELASVLPAFLFAKGVGHAVNNQLVWDVIYRDNKLLVNGTDLLAMRGGGRK